MDEQIYNDESNELYNQIIKYTLNNIKRGEDRRLIVSLI